MEQGSYSLEELTCGYHLNGQNKWYPTSFTVSSQSDGNLTLACKSNHLTLFSIIEAVIITPPEPTPPSDSGNVILMVGLVIGIVVVVVFLFVFLRPKKKKR